MEELLHHLGCIKPCKYRDNLPYQLVSRISAINRINVTTVAFFIEVAELSGVSFRIKDLQLKGRLEVLLYVVARS